jgi:hypothetical protein
VAWINRKPEPDRDAIFEIFKSCREKPSSETKLPEDFPSNGTNLNGLENHGLPNTENTTTISIEVRVKSFLLSTRSTFGNYWKLLETPELRKRTLLIWTLFITVDLVYYGVVFDSATLTSDPFMLVFLAY